MHTRHIGILRGGPSPEYEVSLKTGSAVFHNVPKQYEPVDILISKDGTWHKDGLPTIPARILPHLDGVFNALHGVYGEDGTVQKILDHFAVPYTGSDVMASALGMNKPMAKKMFRQAGLKVPYGEIIRIDDFPDAQSVVGYIFRKIPLPFVVKPVRGGSSVGVAIVRMFNDILPTLQSAFEYTHEVLVEEYIRGREATCGVVDSFRNESHHALLPIEILAPHTSQFFDYEAKYSGQTQELCPSPNFTADEKREIEHAAITAHRAIGARHYSRSDFIISPRGLYILEINTLPGLTEESLLPKSLAAGGTSFQQFLDHILSLTLKK